MTSSSKCLPSREKDLQRFRRIRGWGCRFKGSSDEEGWPSSRILMVANHVDVFKGCMGPLFSVGEAVRSGESRFCNPISAWNGKLCGRSFKVANFLTGMMNRFMNRERIGIPCFHGDGEKTRAFKSLDFDNQTLQVGQQISGVVATKGWGRNRVVRIHSLVLRQKRLYRCRNRNMVNPAWMHRVATGNSG